MPLHRSRCLDQNGDLLPMNEPNRKPDDRARLPAALRADCSRCEGLCCVADAFYAVQGFGYDKPAHQPCRHLTVESRCDVHDQRAALGFTACIGFDCHGAGQRVTRDLGLGADWRGSPAIAAGVFTAYATYVALHRLMATLAVAETAAGAPLQARIRQKRAELDELCGADEAKEGALDVTRLQREVLELVREVRAEAAAAGSRRG
jgi:hypothetical protein